MNIYEEIQPLLDAAARGDGDACKASLAEIGLAFHGGHPLTLAIQAARKRANPIADKPVAAFPLPVPGHLPGSTIAKPKIAA